MITIASIQRRVAEEYAAPLSAMTERDGLGSRRPERSHPRQVAMVLAAFLTEHSFPRIGFYFGGRDHTTVLHAMKSVEARPLKGGEKGQKIHNTMRCISLEMARH
jgi:chromosomal replication initiator protein